MIPCSVPECSRAHYGKGYCHTHYMRLRRNGDVNVILKPANGTVTNWLETVALNFEGDECLPFPFSTQTNGYGMVDGELAHRFVCRRAHGDPDEGIEAAHSCGKRICVNKRHLRWATCESNEADKLIHGTRTRGERHGQAKLTEADVIAIRAAEGPQRNLSSQFGVVQQTISAIKTGKAWSWL